MNAHELLSDLPLGPGDTRLALLYARLLLSYLADHVYLAELANGSHVRDVTDFAQWCRELAEEAAKIGKFPSPSNGAEVSIGLEVGTGLKVLPPRPQQRWETDATCHRCGHIHTGDGECGMFMGTKAGYCLCDSKVSA
jgi:hypothetical protein